MAVPTAITDLSATIASNSPAGGDTVFPELDNYLRAAFGFIRQGDAKASDVASAATTAIGAASGRIVDVTGTTTITSFGTVAAGIWRIVRFTGALTLTHNATSLILPGAANITTGAGDCAIAVSLGSGNWVVTHYQKATGIPVYTSAPRFAATNSGTTTATGVIQSFTETEDTNSAFDASTGVFTAPVAGVYSFFADGFANRSAGNTMTVAVALQVNGSTVDIETPSLASALDGRNSEPWQLSYSYALAAGDTVRLNVTTFSNATSVTTSYFRGCLCMRTA